MDKYLMNKYIFNFMRFLFFAILFGVFPSDIYAKLPTTIIQNCYDGDTCTTIYGEKIRLACIDTPEFKGKKANPVAAKEARDFLNNLLSNQEVSIRRITTDRYGRTVAEIFKNNINIQKLIIEEGFGKIHEKFSAKCKMYPNYYMFQIQTGNTLLMNPHWEKL